MYKILVKDMKDEISLAWVTQFSKDVSSILKITCKLTRTLLKILFFHLVDRDLVNT